MSAVEKETQDADTSWAGDLPEGWSEVHLRWLARLYAGGTPDKSKDEYWADGTIPWINSGAVNQGLVTEPSAYISQAGFENSSARWVPEGALVMALAGQGKTKGMVAQMGFTATCNQSMAAIVPSGINARFLFYWLTANYRRIRSGASDDLRDGLNLQMLGDIPCPVPATNEAQGRIANFLDDKTTRIDALITEKEQLVERIAELRHSQFSTAVTLGLEQGRKTYSTGHPALPELPIGWKLSRLKWVCSLLRDGTHTPPPRVEVGVPLLSVRNVQDGEFTFLSDDSHISEADYLELNRSFEVLQGDVLLAVVGATMGKVAEVREMGRPFQIQRSLAVMRPKAAEIGPTLLAAAIRSKYFQNLLWQNTGFSAQPGTYLGALANFPIPVAPLEEQKQILAYLARKERDFDLLTEHTVKHVSRLREYRSSLISAAVTGQLDESAFKTSVQ